MAFHVDEHTENFGHFYVTLLQLHNGRSYRLSAETLRAG